MRNLLSSLAVGLLGLGLCAQTSISWNGSIASPASQVIPDPINSSLTGQLALYGIYAPANPLAAASLKFSASGVPAGFAGNLVHESVWFLVDLGVANTPGVNMLGGQVFLPLYQPVTYILAETTYLGPADTVPAGGSSGGVQDGLLRFGRRLDLSNLLVPGAIGVNLCIQAALIDATNRAFTSNAINFQVM